MMETSRALPSICLQNLRATGSCCARFSGFHWCKRSVWRPETAGFRSLKKNILGQGTPTLRSSIQTTPHYPSNSGVKMVSHGMPNGVQKKKTQTADHWELGNGAISIQASSLCTVCISIIVTSSCDSLHRSHAPRDGRSMVEWICFKRPQKAIPPTITDV